MAILRPMLRCVRLFLFTALMCAAHCSLAQKDSTKVVAKWGIDNSYTGMTVTESSVYGIRLLYATKHHALALGPHILYHDLFAGQSDWKRFGAQFTYSYFPIGSNRLFSPFLFYDMNYSFIRSVRQVVRTPDDGIYSYNAVRQVITHTIAHHFGIGTRANVYKGLFIHLSVGAGFATFGDRITESPLQSTYPTTRQTSSIFSGLESVYMFRVGVGYQIGADRLKHRH